MLYLDIISCIRYAQRRESCRSTWLTRMPFDVQWHFVVGKSDRFKFDGNEPDVVELDASDEYEMLPEKMMACFRHALQDDRWDWYGKVDDDTYVHGQRLMELINSVPDDVPGVADVMASDIGYVYGGSGYFLRRPVVEAVVRRHDSGEFKIENYGFEDKQIGKAIRKAGYTLQNKRRLLWNYFQLPHGLHPTPENNVITTHKCYSGAVMDAVHAAAYGEPLTEQQQKLLGYIPR